MSTPSPRSIDPGHVRLERADGVATITFGHPRGNSLPGALLTSLAETVTAAGADSGVRVIVLRSEGTGAFCGGASFDELVAIADPEAGQRYFSGFAKVILAMIRAPKFVVTRVHGKAAGGGVGLIAASDYAVALAGASVKLSELAVGIGPFVVGPVIQRKVGLGAYQAMSVDADWRTAVWGAQHGLFAEVCDSLDAVDQMVTNRARWLAGCNPDAMAQLKKVFWEGTESWDQRLAARAAMSGSLVLTKAARDAIARMRKG